MNIGKILKPILDDPDSEPVEKTYSIAECLTNLGVADCVIEDWCNEPLRRHYMKQRMDFKAMEKRHAKGRGRDHRRVIESEVCPAPDSVAARYVRPREIMFHATKGFRSRRVEV